MDTKPTIKNFIVVILPALLTVFIIFFLVMPKVKENRINSENINKTQVTNFEECIKAGNPAMESYPRQCRHGNRTFTELIGQVFNDNTLGISFDYPLSFGESELFIADSGNRPGGETGKKLIGTFSQFPGLEFGGITDDFSAGRSGIITDARGFVEENGIYYFKFVSGNNYRDYEIQPLKVLEKDFGKILILNDQSFKAEREGVSGPVLGVGKGNLAGLVNLRGKEFSGLIFYNKNTEELSLKDFEMLLNSVIIYSPEDLPTTANTKLKAIDCMPEQRNMDACIEIYQPVCGQIQVECIKAPCNPVKETFENSCKACANSRVLSYVEGECMENDEIKY